MISQLIYEKARQDEQSFNNSKYYLSYSILSFVKIKCMFMVRKIGQSLLNAHGRGGGGSQAPSLSLILEQTRLVQSENFFIDRCSKDVPTNKKFVWNNNNNNNSSHH